MKQIVLAMVFVLLAGTMAQAQSVPPLVNYQGMLTDANGTAQTGTKKLEFNLYDAATGGNKVWGPQVFDSVPLVNGMFNVILGTTDASGKSIADAFGAKDRYLGMKVDGGTELVPRQQILSTPFALQSEHSVKADNSSEAAHAQKADIAETIQGSDLYVNSNGNVGIGIMTPEAKLDVNGDMKINCRICLAWADSGSTTPSKETCVSLTPNSQSERLGFNGDVDWNDGLWLFYRCP